jgi:hypothetical protein
MCPATLLEGAVQHACLDGDVARFFARLRRERVSGAGGFGHLNKVVHAPVPPVAGQKNPLTAVLSTTAQC